MDIAILGSLAGGIGLFLLGMHLMTQGLRQAAGKSLKNVLHAATQSRLKGLLSGTLITALVQSSSAVTVATIGFVNAGLLTIPQSVAVIYGCNIGTTMTGWLVALIGFKFKISAFALPIIALGMLLNTVASKERFRQIGFALAGFGVFFIGLDFLKGSFEDLEKNIDLTVISALPFSLLLFLVAGFMLTFLMQASAASMAITLSLAATGSISITAAAALVIGANLGTTSTAMLAVIGATPNAKRIAAAHVIFNVITGAVGFSLLILFSSQVNNLHNQEIISTVTLLALFHTVFNVLGVVIMWPLTDAMVKLLKRRFLSQEENISKPQYLDKNILSTPYLAVEAMTMELGRVSRLCSSMALAAVSEEGPNPPQLEKELTSVMTLVSAVGEFNQQIAQQNLDPDITDILPSSLRTARYLNEIARLSTRLVDYHETLENISDTSIKQNVFIFKKDISKLLQASRIEKESDTQSEPARKILHKLEYNYQALKTEILNAATSGKLDATESVTLLDALSHLRRLAEQAEKSSSYWSSMLPIHSRGASSATSA
ncbi:Na/Pi cotransporter family protein [Neptunomonas japonica]|uniref:Na/Pi cotransporter family protein n=1 Tax=Neptunomonas japonica TaxID=417574 RepID=UPI0003FFE5B2|nr:Na/Pi symporter [Neptunomonas japonica]